MSKQMPRYVCFIAVYASNVLNVQPTNNKVNYGKVKELHKKYSYYQNVLEIWPAR